MGLHLQGGFAPDARALALYIAKGEQALLSASPIGGMFDEQDLSAVAAKQTIADQRGWRGVHGGVGSGQWGRVAELSSMAAAGMKIGSGACPSGADLDSAESYI